MPDVVTGDLAANDYAEMAAEIERLRRRTALLGTVVGLLAAMLRGSKLELYYERFPKGDAKRILLRAIERELDVEVIDTSKNLDGAYSEAYVDAVHFNQLGRERLADNLLEGLGEILSTHPRLACVLRDSGEKG